MKKMEKNASKEGEQVSEHAEGRGVRGATRVVGEKKKTKKSRIRILTSYISKRCCSGDDSVLG